MTHNSTEPVYVLLLSSFLFLAHDQMHRHGRKNHKQLLRLLKWTDVLDQLSVLSLRIFMWKVLDRDLIRTLVRHINPIQFIIELQCFGTSTRKVISCYRLCYDSYKQVFPPPAFHFSQLKLIRPPKKHTFSSYKEAWRVLKTFPWRITYWMLLSTDTVHCCHKWAAEGWVGEGGQGTDIWMGRAGQGNESWSGGCGQGTKDWVDEKGWGDWSLTEVWLIGWVGGRSQATEIG